jgi:hypothetical protein
VQEVAQCLEVVLGFLQVGQVAAVFEHDELGTSVGTESSLRRSVMS